MSSQRTARRKRAELIRHGGVEFRGVIPPEFHADLEFRGVIGEGEIFHLDPWELGERLLACIDGGDVRVARNGQAKKSSVKSESVMGHRAKVRRPSARPAVAMIGCCRASRARRSTKA
jgi:hypothetical protein